MSLPDLDAPSLNLFLFLTDLLMNQPAADAEKHAILSERVIPPCIESLTPPSVLYRYVQRLLHVKKGFGSKKGLAQFLKRTLGWNIPTHDLQRLIFGVPLNILASFPVLRYTASLHPQACLCCFEAFLHDTLVQQLPCQHCFHIDCLHAYCASKKWCPACQKMITVPTRCHDPRMRYYRDM